MISRVPHTYLDLYLGYGSLLNVPVFAPVFSVLQWHRW